MVAGVFHSRQIRAGQCTLGSTWTQLVYSALLDNKHVTRYDRCPNKTQRVTTVRTVRHASQGDLP